MYSLFHWFPSWHIRAALFSIFLIFSLLFLFRLFIISSIFFFHFFFTRSPSHPAQQVSCFPARWIQTDEGRPNEGIFLHIVIWYLSLRFSLLSFSTLSKKDVKLRPSFYRPPTQTMDARRVLYCCSVGRASFVTIRHIPFRFRTARSTNNNNKKSAGYIWTKWPSSHAYMLPLAAATTNSPGLSFLSLSPVGSDTVKNRCRGGRCM